MFPLPDKPHEVNAVLHRFSETDIFKWNVWRDNITIRTLKSANRMIFTFFTHANFSWFEIKLKPIKHYILLIKSRERKTLLQIN